MLNIEMFCKVNKHTSIKTIEDHLRFLNGGVLRNLNMYSFQKLCPVCSATWLSDDLSIHLY